MITPINYALLPLSLIFSTMPLMVHEHNHLHNPPYCPTVSGPHSYNLHSRQLTNPNLLGLGIPPPSIELKPTWGRPSKISKAIKSAGVDVAQGCQNTIERALRATNTLDSIP